MRPSDEHTALVFSHDTALCAVRHARCRYGCLPWTMLDDDAQQALLPHLTANAAHLDRGDLYRLGLGAMGGRVDLLVASRSARRKSQSVLSHILHRPLPPAAIGHISGNVYCSGPELLVVQYAAKHDVYATAALITELCGGFSMGPCHAPRSEPNAPSYRNRETGYRECEAVTTTARLRRFLMQYRPNARCALAALSIAVDGSRSPSEAIMNMMFHASRVCGGFGFRNLRCNHRIDLSLRAQDISHMPYVVADGYIPEAKTALEYNGGMHDEHGRRVHDERRANGLHAMGITTTALNDASLRSIEELERLAEQIYKRAGKRYQNRTRARAVKQIMLLNGLRDAYGLRPC